MPEIILKIIGISAILAIPTQSVLLGMNAGMPYFKEFIANKKVVFKYIVTMFIVTPLIAVIFNYFFQDFRSLWIAVLIISLNPASPGMIKSMTKLSGEANISTIWMIITIILSLIFIPINLLILESVMKIQINLGIIPVVTRLTILFLIPMAAGILIKEYLPKYESMIKKIFTPVSKIALVVLIICLLYNAVPMIIAKGLSFEILLLAFIITVLIIAHFVSAPEKIIGPILPYSIVQRLPAPAIILTQLNNTMEQHIPVIISYSILGTIVMLFYNKFFIRNYKSE